MQNNMYVKALIALCVALVFVTPGSALCANTAKTVNINTMPSPGNPTLWSRGTLYVDDDRPEEWYDATHLHTIQAAVDAALVGDTVYVYNGTYVEHVMITKQVAIVGESRDNVVVNGGGNGNTFAIVTPATLASISSVTATNGYHGVYIYKSSSNSITDCTLVGNTQNGVYIYTNANYNVVTNCTMARNTLYGIYVRSASYNVFTDCTVDGNLNRGVNTMSPSNYNQFNRLTVYNNTNHGIYLMGMSNRVANSSFSHHGTGLWLGTSSSTILNCTFSYNTNYGIFAQGASSNTVRNCTAHDNNAALYFYSACTSNTIINNTLYDNTNGLSFSGNANTNIVRDNTALDNRGYGIIISTSSNNQLRRNTMAGNAYNFGITGSTVAHYTHDIDQTNTLDGRPIWYLTNAADIVLDETDTIGFLALVSCTNITVQDNDISSVLLVSTTQSTLSNVSVHNSYNGIFLLQSTNNQILDCTAFNNSFMGFNLQGSSNNLLSNCTAYNNTLYNGYYLSGSSNDNILTGCTADHNWNGFSIDYISNSNDVTSCNSSTNINAAFYIINNQDNNLTDCHASNNTYGVYLESTTNNKMRGASLHDNTYNFAVAGTNPTHYIQDIDPTNTVNDRPIRYLVDHHDQALSQTDAYGYLALISCSNITVQNIDTSGVLLVYTTQSTFTNVTSHNNGDGFSLIDSHTNTLTGCIAHTNIAHGIRLTGCSNTHITACTAYDNLYYGIYLTGSSTNNTIEDCTSTNNTDGIMIQSSTANIITGCMASNNMYGICLEAAPANILRNNSLSSNDDNLVVAATTLEEYDQDIDASNLIYGKPICYLVGQSNLTLDTDAIGYLALISCTNITVENADVYGVFMVATTGSTLTAVTSHDNINGFHLYQSANNLLTGCTVYNNTLIGFYLVDSSSNTLSDCTAYSNDDGIYLLGATNTAITRTIAHDNYRGIHIVASGTTVTDSQVFNNHYGFYLWEGSYDNTAASCDVYANTCGLFIARASTNHFTSCNIYNNTDYGVYIDQAADNTVTNSNIYHNTYGVYLRYMADDNTLYQNNIINNIYNSHDECSNTWNDAYPTGGNYWSDYTGTDQYSGEYQDIPGSDGIGDTPYAIPEGPNQDCYPLMSPIDQTPPAITDIQATPNPQTTTEPVTISCTVTDNWDLIDSVILTITGPEGYSLETTMNNGYSYQDTYTTMGVYYYYIQATDTTGNRAVSDTYSFVVRLEFDQPISSVTPLPLWHNTTAFDITATAYDNTGVANITLYCRYSPDQTTWTDWTAYDIDTEAPWSWTFTGADGYYEYYTIAVDDCGNIEDTPNTPDVTTGIDTLQPTTSIDKNGTLGANGWYTSLVTITLTATDMLSGSESTWYQIDADPWQQYSTPFPVSGDAEHIVSAYSVDQAGNTETATQATFKIDTKAPTTTPSLDGFIGSQGDYITDVTVTLTATDNASGTNYTRYQINNDTWLNYTDSFMLTEDGTYTLAYYSIDQAGNTETIKQTVFEIMHDILPPTTIHTFTGTTGTQGWFVSSVTTLLSAQDDLAGVSYTKYKLDNGNWTKYTGLFTIAGDGQHTLTYYSVDNIGNREDNTTVLVKIDTAKPTIELTVNKTGLSTWLLTAAINDMTSGIAKVEFYLDNEYLGEVTGAPYVFEITEKGTAQAIVYDNAGNNQISGGIPVSAQFVINDYSPNQDAAPQQNPSPFGQSQASGMLIQRYVRIQ